MPNEIKVVFLGVLVLAMGVLTTCSFEVVDPGNRGVKVTLGQTSEVALPEGVAFKMPFVTTIYEMSVRQQANELKASCFSADLQQVNADLKILYRTPEASVVKIFRDYQGNAFDSLVAPRILEAIKEVTANESAEGIVKKREQIKSKALEVARAKIGDILVIEDIVIQNIDLSDELEKAIEQKMVQEQEASKAKFTKQKAEIEAETAVIRAQGEAKAIQIRGNALKENPRVVDMQIAEKWNGVAPLVVGNGQGANILLPMGKKE